LRGSGGAPDDACAHVDQIWRAIHYDCDRRTGMLGIRSRPACAQENDVGLRHASG
jgi:hypothetical protein